MHFGREPETDVNDIDFSLPDVPSGLRAQAENLRFFPWPQNLGDERWPGSLYPAGIKNGDYFTEVVKHFNFIELSVFFLGI